MPARIVRWAAVPVAASLVLAGGLVPAGAGTVSGWRISAVLSGPSTLLQSVATSGPGNAVSAGTTASSLVVQQWNGSAWQAITPPAGFVNLTSASVNVSAAGTSAPGNTWLFAEKSQTSTTQYALEWNGSAWTVFKLSSTNMVLGTAVFGPGNVWEFGQKPGSGANLGYGPAWVLHYDGSAWHAVTVPATPVWVSAPAATDIWALGPSAATVNKPTQVTVAVHWNGSSWRTLALPKLTPVDGQPWVPDGIVAQSARQVWVAETVAVSPGTGTGPPGVTLLHWNGTAWAVAARDLKHRYSPGLTSDGHGGFWLVANLLSQPVGEIVHYAGGRWSRQPAPTEPGFTGVAGDLTLIPGTTSVWGTGLLTPAGSGTTAADIIKHGP
jgi:hypothetical protein